jgi:hypothetical protein
MNASELVESKFMVAEQFGRKGIAKEPRVTIKDVRIEKQAGENWGLVYFEEEWARPLKVNRTHQRALILMFGEETRAWHGKQVDLTVKFGNFPNGKRTAVRIKGSPTLTRTLSFTVRKFGRGEDVYNLIPTGSKVVLGPGFIRFGQKSGAWGKPFADFDDEQLQQLMVDAEDFINASGKKWPDLEANVHEIFEELKARAAARLPPPELEAPAEPEVPL